jgi:hypothetical protein
MESYVYNSPSVQEHNSGTFPGYIEELVMNRLCDKVEILQDLNGIHHFRNKPTWKLTEIIADSDRLYKLYKGMPKNFIHMAYHTNAEKKGTVRGGESFFYPGSPESELLAKLVMKYLEPVTPTDDRGTKDGKGLRELNEPKAISNLTEFIFHTNYDDAKDLIERMDKYAEAIVRAQCEYFRLTFKESEVNESMLIVIPYGTDDEGPARTLATHKKGAVLDWDKVSQIDNVITVGGPKDAVPKRICRSFLVVSGANALETAEAVCKYIREGK